jgi:hypothetical protein
MFLQCPPHILASEFTLPKPHPPDNAGASLTIPRRFPQFRICSVLLLWAAFGPLLSHGAEVEPGNVLVIKEPISGEAKVRLLRKWNRLRGSPTATGVDEKGRPVTIDTMALLWTIDLASLEIPSYLNKDHLTAARNAAAAAAVGLKRFPQTGAYVTAPLARLQAEIVRAEKGDRKLKGQWYTPAQWAAFQEKNRSTISRGTLVLKNGTKYHDVDITSATPQELRILHADGAAVIPMSEVPVAFQREYLKNLLPPAK